MCCESSSNGVRRHQQGWAASVLPRRRGRCTLLELGLGAFVVLRWPCQRRYTSVFVSEFCLDCSRWWAYAPLTGSCVCGTCGAAWRRLLQVAASMCVSMFVAGVRAGACWRLWLVFLRCFTVLAIIVLCGMRLCVGHVILLSWVSHVASVVTEDSGTGLVQVKLSNCARCKFCTLRSFGFLVRQYLYLLPAETITAAAMLLLWCQDMAAVWFGVVGASSVLLHWQGHFQHTVYMHSLPAVQALPFQARALCSLCQNSCIMCKYSWWNDVLYLHYIHRLYLHMTSTVY